MAAAEAMRLLLLLLLADVREEECGLLAKNDVAAIRCRGFLFSLLWSSVLCGEVAGGLGVIGRASRTLVVVPNERPRRLRVPWSCTCGTAGISPGTFLRLV